MVFQKFYQMMETKLDCCKILLNLFSFLGFSKRPLFAVEINLKDRNYCKRIKRKGLRSDGDGRMLSAMALHLRSGMDFFLIICSKSWEIQIKSSETIAAAFCNRVRYAKIARKAFEKETISYHNIMASVLQDSMGGLVFPFQPPQLRKNDDPLAEKIDGGLLLASASCPLGVDISPVIWPRAASFLVVELFFIICSFTEENVDIKRNWPKNIDFVGRDQDRDRERGTERDYQLQKSCCRRRGWRKWERRGEW